MACTALVALSGCSLKSVALHQIADELASQDNGDEEDLELARDASAFYLKFSESVLFRQPDHAALAESVASGFVQYAYAFVANPADRIEQADAREAARLRQRAGRLYDRARRHALRALAANDPSFNETLDDLASPDRLVIPPSRVGLAYWAAAAWGGLISLSKDDPEVVADLPLAIHLAERAWAADPAWGDGALTGLLARFESSRPGGDPARALALYDQAIGQAGERSISPLLAKAEGYAQATGDRALFEHLLGAALAPRPATSNGHALEDQVVRQRARWLLESADDLF
ncbi:MAG: hypothetical protein KDG55_07370 [Rhodocyclaceae bacterium]|nr:hypothetical protein [Rhodocyclaceae bacterium]